MSTAVIGAACAALPGAGHAARMALLRELAPVLAGKPEGAALEAFARWSRRKPGYVPGTRVWRAELADTVLRQMTGQSLDVFRGAERERALREFVREAEQQPAVYEVDGTARGTDWDAGWPGDTAAADTLLLESDGLDDAGEPAPPVERHHSDLLRHLRALLDAVLAGRTTVLAAHQAYGARQGGMRGRPRRFPDFAAFLDDQIRYAGDPAVQRELCALLARSTKQRAQAASADTERINRLLEETGRVRAERLRELRAELMQVFSEGRH